MAYIEGRQTIKPNTMGSCTIVFESIWTIDFGIDEYYGRHAFTRASFITRNS